MKYSREEGINRKNRHIKDRRWNANKRYLYTYIVQVKFVKGNTKILMIKLIQKIRSNTKIGKERNIYLGGRNT